MIFRTESRYWIALIMATLLLQIAIVWIVIQYEPAVPVSAKPDAARTSMTENALPTTRVDELPLADTPNGSISVAPQLPAAMDASASAMIESDVLADSDLSFRAEAIIWESEKDYNLVSGVDSAEFENFPELETESIDDMASLVVVTDSSSESQKAYQRAATVLDEAVASGRWSYDDFTALVTEMQQLNELQREDLALRFHTALRIRHLTAATIADVGVPMPF